MSVPWPTSARRRSSTGGFKGWQSLGGFVKEITVGANLGGALQVFAIGGDDALWTRRQNAGPSDLSAGFTAWASLGGFVKQATAAGGIPRNGPPVGVPTVGGLAVSSHADGALQVFAIGGDNAAWGRRQATPGGSDASGFLPWLANGGYVKQLAAATNQDHGLVQLFAIGGDNALWTRTPVGPIPLMLDGTPSSPATSRLSDLELRAAIVEALRRWQAAGLPDSQFSAMQYRIADLPDGYLGWYAAGTVLIDADAAGAGWFIDPTPALDEEFDATGRALAGSAADGRVDLLSVVLHELGHASGLDHGGGIMAESLATGIRRR